jgi:hypothetical protein
MRELTYLPKAIARGSQALQLRLGNTALGLATYEYTAETEGVLHLTAYATSLEPVPDYIQYNPNCLSYTSGFL